MIGDSSDLDRVLRDNGIEILLVAGTKTNVCCESTARDASMMEYRVALLSDGNGDLDRRGACRRAQRLPDLVRRRDDRRRGDGTAGCSREAQRGLTHWTARFQRAQSL